MPNDKKTLKKTETEKPTPKPTPAPAPKTDQGDVSLDDLVSDWTT